MYSIERWKKETKFRNFFEYARFCLTIFSWSRMLINEFEIHFSSYFILPSRFYCREQILKIPFIFSVNLIRLSEIACQKKFALIALDLCYRL